MMNRILKLFADESPSTPSNESTDEEIKPYSELIESIHNTMVSDPKKAKRTYGVDPTKFYLVFDSNNELNDGNYDSDSILALFSPYLDEVKWSESTNIITDSNRGTVSLFYPEINIDATVVKTSKGMTFHVPVSQFKLIKEKLDAVEPKKTEEENEGLESPAESIQGNETTPSAVGEDKGNKEEKKE